jgi:hypothetical protein
MAINSLEYYNINIMCDIIFCQGRIFILLLSSIAIIGAQNISSRDLDLGTDDKLVRMIESFVLEHQIEPESYVLGPGDKLGLSIISSVNLTYIITITPMGHLWIPDIGTVHVSGIHKWPIGVIVIIYVRFTLEIILRPSLSPGPRTYDSGSIWCSNTKDSIILTSLSSVPRSKSLLLIFCAPIIAMLDNNSINILP